MNFDLMDENAVIEVVCSKLQSLGCEIIQRLTTTEKGIDIIARNVQSSEEYIVEAKGGTSSRVGSARFGRPYTQSQIFDRAAKGVFTCINLRVNYPNYTKQHIVLAVPEAKWFRFYLEPITEQLSASGIEVWYTTNEVI